MQVYNIFYIFSGIWINVVLAFIACSLGFLIGFSISYIQYLFPFMRPVLRNYVALWRRTPIVFQLMVFCLFLSHYIKISNFLLCAIVLSLNSAAYFSYIFSDLFSSLSEHYEMTALSLGFSHMQTIKYILLPCALQNGQNTLNGEFLSVTKETSVVSMFGIGDILFRTKEVGMLYYDFIGPLIVSGISFYFINFLNEKYFSNFFFNSLSNLIQMVV